LNLLQTHYINNTTDDNYFVSPEKKKMKKGKGIQGRKENLKKKSEIYRRRKMK